MVQLLANVHSAKGNHEAAERGLLRALETTRADPRKSAELMIDFGKALRSRGKGSEQAAASMFERAIAHLRARGNPSMPDGRPRNDDCERAADRKRRSSGLQKKTN